MGFDKLCNRNGHNDALEYQPRFVGPVKQNF